MPQEKPAGVNRRHTTPRAEYALGGVAHQTGQVGRELGVRYVLEGSVRKAIGRVRITGQLIEAATGHHVWADRFDGNLEDVFDLQDRVTESVVGAIEPSLRLAEIGRARAKSTANLDAYDCFLRALHSFYQLSRESRHASISSWRLKGILNMRLPRRTLRWAI
jgi:adenylate cyclase